MPHIVNVNLDGLPVWMQSEILKLDELVDEFSRIGAREIKIATEKEINDIKSKITIIEQHHQHLLQGGVVRYIGQNKTWVTLDNMARDEVQNKLELIRTLWDGGGDVTFTGEVIDISVENPDDDFSDEEEEESFW